jgi:hypothetical protein
MIRLLVLKSGKVRVKVGGWDSEKGYPTYRTVGYTDEHWNITTDLLAEIRKYDEREEILLREFLAKLKQDYEVDRAARALVELPEHIETVLRLLDRVDPEDGLQGRDESLLTFLEARAAEVADRGSNKNVSLGTHGRLNDGDANRLRPAVERLKALLPALDDALNDPDKLADTEVPDDPDASRPSLA